MTPLIVRVSEQQAATIRSEAARLNMSVSAYIRVTLVERKCTLYVPEINRSAWSELAMLAKTLRAHLSEGSASASTDNLIDLSEIIEVTRRRLIGLL